MNQFIFIDCSGLTPAIARLAMADFLLVAEGAMLEVSSRREKLAVCKLVAIAIETIIQLP